MYQIEEIRSKRIDLMSSEADAQKGALKFFAILVSSGDLNKINAVTENEVVPCLALATWALRNIAGRLSKHTEVVVANGVIPRLVQLLSSKKYIIQMKAAWALGNIACDSLEKRDIIVENGALAPLMCMLKTTNKHVLMMTRWTLRKTCSEIIPPRFAETLTEEDKPDESAILSGLQVIIFVDHSSEVGFHYFSYDPKYSKFILYVLMVMGNLAQCGNTQKQWLLGPSRKLSDKLILKEACWVIGNLARGKGTIYRWTIGYLSNV
ncbi:importin subunit alpha-3-like [Vicia villosa]|uniref:importin subunit alpha-3-like n=1 Tax=Vicia villosa TaxID=3911 RepID=UPI00273CA58F|nr:importin subunit alpha-3-like [Vicia villosa]